jgi:hypothetical protein
LHYFAHHFAHCHCCSSFNLALRVRLFSTLRRRQVPRLPSEQVAATCFSGWVGSCGHGAYIQCEGPPKKIDGPPVHLLDLRPTHPPSAFFFLIFFLSTFLGVSRQGEFKNTIKIFGQKVRVKNFSQNFDKNFDVSFSSTFLFYRVFGCFLAMGVQNATKKFCKKIVSKMFYKQFDQKSKTDFLSTFLIRFLSAFLGEVSSKAR